jgi:2-oxoisovalerate dehydrogenase E1 component
LYRSIKADIPNEYYTLEIGKASIEKSGNDISVITYGMGVHWAKNYLNEHPEISMEIIDLKTLLPLDLETIYNSVRKTGKVIVLHEDCMTGGIGGEIAALITEHCFEHLDAPVKRVASIDTPVPFTSSLENQFLPIDRFAIAINDLLTY